MGGRWSVVRLCTQETEAWMVARVGRNIPVIFNSARHVKHAADSMILHKRHSRILPLREAHKKQYNVHCNVQSADISQD
jgi:hypothetical protein